jgi:hypothetical protein
VSIFDGDWHPWGYCKDCDRLVELKRQIVSGEDPVRVLAFHKTALSGNMCDGSGELPGVVPCEMTPEQEQAAVKADLIVRLAAKGKANPYM